MLWALAETMAIDEDKFKAAPPGSFNGSLESIIQEAKRAGMDLCVLQAERAKSYVSGPDATGKQFFVLVRELGTRTTDYLKSRSALMIPEAQRGYFDAPTKGWEQPIERFPRLADHIEEASKCLALGRNTACVYHSMAIVQEALEALGRRLSVPLDPYSDTWNGLLSKVENAIKAKQGSTPKKSWKKVEPFYAELVSDLRAIKNAWRNPTMHFRRTYNDEQAGKIYARVQDFMGHASLWLKSRNRI
jgi:hypothetical protein